jgi:hypothetical protein
MQAKGECKRREEAMANSDDARKARPDRFIVEVDKLDLTEEEVKSVMNDIVKTTMDRIRGLGTRAQQFDKWVSFDKWQSFGQHQ